MSSRSANRLPASLSEPKLPLPPRVPITAVTGTAPAPPAWLPFALATLGPQIGSIVYDVTKSYDEYQVVIGLVLLASAAMTFNIPDCGAPPREPAVAAAPSIA